MDETINTAVGSCMAALAIAAVVARFYARYTRQSGYKWDDWLMLLSLVTMIGTDIVSICGSSFIIQTQDLFLVCKEQKKADGIITFPATTSDPDGPEKATTATDTEDYTPADVLYTKLSWATTLLYFTITSSTKLSILLMYNRIFSIDRVSRRLVIILSVVVTCFWIGCTVANLTNCVPMKYIWINSLADPRYCINYNHFWFACGLVETGIDVLILLLPIKAVLGLQFSNRQKVAVVSVFLLGSFVVVSGLLKAIFGYIPGSRQPGFFKTQLWTVVHCGVGIVCGCVPICWTLLNHLEMFKPQKWQGVSRFKKYWYKRSGWSSVEKRTTPAEPNTRAIQLMNEVPERGLTASSRSSDEEAVQVPLQELQISPVKQVQRHGHDQRLAVLEQAHARRDMDWGGPGDAYSACGQSDRVGI